MATSALVIAEDGDSWRALLHEALLHEALLHEAETRRASPALGKDKCAEIGAG